MQDFLSPLYQQFLDTSAFEWLATITGFLCVFLAAKENIWNWPMSIVSVLTYLFIFFQHKLYGDAVLQVYFLITAGYGWYYWSRQDQGAEKPVQSFRLKQMLYTVLIIVLLSTMFAFALKHWTDSDVPYVDGFCTAVSFVAQFLLTRKVLQTWLLWVVVDICYIPLYLYKGLFLTALLYLAFAVIAWNGYRNWRKSYNDIRSRHLIHNDQ